MKELSKGEKVSLNKVSDLKTFIIDINYNSPIDYEIDSSVLMLSEKNKLEEEDDFIFYNNPLSKCGSVQIQDFQGVKKRITVKTEKITSTISRLMFVTTIDNGDSLNQRFNNITSLNISISDSNNKLINYDIQGLDKETAVILIEIYKHNNEWKLQATGNGFNSGLDAILKEYGSEKVQIQDNSASEVKPEVIHSPPPVVEPVKPQGVKLSKEPVGTIDFVKKHNERIDLAKKEVSAMGLSNQRANVVLVMDISGSMYSLFKKGIVQDTFDRVLPLAMQFDDDGSIEVWLFDKKCVHSQVPYTLTNRENYVKKEIENKYKLGGGTEYSKPIREINQMFGHNRQMTYVLFFTDGDCSDGPETEKAMIEVSDKPIFWKFIGLGGNKPANPKAKKGFFNSSNSGSGFNFLEKLDNLSGRKVDNADFFQIYAINEMSDQDLYKGLLEELPSWINTIKTMGLI